MSGQSLGDQPAVGAEQHGTPQPVGAQRHQRLDVGPLELSARDPHHRVVCRQRRLRGVRVGRLGVVDIADAGDSGDQGDPMGVGGEGLEAGAHGERSDAVGPSQRGGGERIGEVVPGHRLAADRQVGDRPQLGRRVLALLDEGAVGQHVVDHADHGDGRHPQREADRTTPVDDVGLHDELLGDGVLDVVDAREMGVGVDLALGSQVLVIGPVPVDVVGSDVEADRRHGRDR